MNIRTGPTFASTEEIDGRLDSVARDARGMARMDESLGGEEEFYSP